MPIKTNGSPERSASMSIPSPITGSVWVGGCFVQLVAFANEIQKPPFGSGVLYALSPRAKLVRPSPKTRIGAVRTIAARLRPAPAWNSGSRALRKPIASSRLRIVIEALGGMLLAARAGTTPTRVRISALVDPAITAAATAIAAPAPRIARDFGHMIIPLIMCTTPSNSGPCSSRNPRP